MNASKQPDKPAEWMVKAAQEIVAKWSGFDTVVASTWDEPFSEAIARRHREGCKIEAADAVGLGALLHMEALEQAARELVESAKRHLSANLGNYIGCDRELESALAKMEELLK
jgi:hypothetical protein